MSNLKCCIQVFFAHENNNIPVLNVYVVEVMLKVLQKAFVRLLEEKMGHVECYRYVLYVFEKKRS